MRKPVFVVVVCIGHSLSVFDMLSNPMESGDAEDAYVCKAARTVEQAAELIEAGFEYVCEMEGFKLFRKRK